MTDPEILARWQGYKPHPNGVSCYLGELKLIGGTLKWPDYLNDTAACDSLLDTLVEKNYQVLLLGSPDGSWVYQIHIGDKYFRAEAHTRREAIVAACLEVARKDQDHDKGYYMAHKAVDTIAEMQAEIDRLKTELTELQSVYDELRLLANGQLNIKPGYVRALESELVRYREGVEVDGHVCMQELGASVPGLSSALLAYPHKVKVLVMKGE